MKETTFTVSNEPDSSGSFPTIQAALEQIPDDNHTPVTILLAPGTYHEKVTIAKPCVTLAGTGETPADTIISFGDFAYDRMDDIGKRGTFRSYTMLIDAHDVTLRNLTVENSSGDCTTHGQAIALYADGDRLVVDSCRLVGEQDTLFTAPLPPQEREPNGFIGPKQNAPRVHGRHYYTGCYICGNVDFIFGGATAYFEHCTIESLCRKGCKPGEPQGFVTAASTPEGQDYGYVFSACSFLSRECPPASVYLGRPWRDFAQTVLLDCTLGAHIHPAGFYGWNRETVADTVFYAEYERNGSPAGRAGFVHRLDEGETAHYSRENVLGGKDHWTPWV